MYCREFIFQKGITYLKSCMVPERQASALSMMYNAFQCHVEAKSALPDLLVVFPILKQMAAEQQSMILQHEDLSREMDEPMEVVSEMEEMKAELEQVMQELEEVQQRQKEQQQQ
ncbi:hypothetical protein DACRYDRAFT_108684 [Dacryopinax primogenitus]|uniref:Uncharacterized protein n=1 Tax=Dacryopinax primogenitus (strain DJM 731) TaxID=1858805 RepID=M5FW73_DACPD|nr:uncharacterized protein DACRYDRAFT_108684 [Dacryopinax primogenitus]EJU00619.1 hypothetical protein DACRYDRAFT_108684 [Dacryopinax primogenitus]